MGHDLEGFGCRGFAVALVLPAEVVQPELPPGYTPTYIVGAGEAFVDLTSFACERVAVGGTNVTDVHVASVSVQVEDANFKSYRWETYVQDASGRVREAFAAAGWPVQEADIAFGDRGVTVSAGSVTYTLTWVAATGTEPTGFPGDYPYVWQAENGTELRFNQHLDTGATILAFGPGHVTAEGGVLGSIQSRTGALDGLANAIATGWTLDFDQGRP